MLIALAEIDDLFCAPRTHHRWRIGVDCAFLGTDIDWSFVVARFSNLSFHKTFLVLPGTARGGVSLPYRNSSCSE
jgi:hypothetical protein